MHSWPCLLFYNWAVFSQIFFTIHALLPESRALGELEQNGNGKQDRNEQQKLPDECHRVSWILQHNVFYNIVGPFCMDQNTLIEKSSCH